MLFEVNTPYKHYLVIEERILLGALGPPLCGAQHHPPLHGRVQKYVYLASHKFEFMEDIYILKKSTELSISGCI